MIDDPGISRKHLEIDINDGNVIARDLGSTNGTVVNQQRLDAPMILGSRVPVRIGATTFELR